MILKLIKYSFLFLVLHSSLYAQNLKQDKNLVKDSLSNGMRYYIYPTKNTENKVVLRLFLKVGSVYENEEQRGLAHFLEHMAFNGTEHFPANGLIKYLESNGAKFGKDINAHTSYNETIYKLSLSSNNNQLLDSAICILSDWAGRLKLEAKEIDSERGVIFSEWRSKQGPKNEASQAFLNILLNDSRYSKRKVIGDTSVILRCSYDRLRNFYKDYYSPNLMAVAVSGDIDVDDVRNKIKKWFGSLNASNKNKPKNYHINNFSNTDYQLLANDAFKEIEFSTIQLAEMSANIRTREAFITDFKRKMIPSLFNARMRTLMKENTKYSSAKTNIGNFMNTKAVVMSACELNNNEAKQALIDYLTEYERILRFGFTNAEINKLKIEYLKSWERSLKQNKEKDPVAAINAMKTDFYYNNTLIDKYEKFKLIKKSIKKQDSLSVLNYIKSTFIPKQTRYLITCPDSLKKSLPDSNEFYSIVDEIRKSKIDRFNKKEKIPKRLINYKIKAGEIVSEKLIPEINVTKLVLSNGANIYYRKSEKENNSTSINGFRAGGLYSLDSSLYLTGLYTQATVAMSGAGNYTRDEISNYLIGKSAKVRFLIDKSRTGVAGQADNSELKTLFELLNLKWTHAKFNDKEFEKIKEKSITKIKNKIETEKDKFSRELAYMVNGMDYTNRRMDEQLIEKELHKSEILNIFNKSFGTAQDYNFVIISDLRLSELKSYIKKYIGSLPSGDYSSNYKYHKKMNFDLDTVFAGNVSDSPKALVSIITQSAKENSDLRKDRILCEMSKNVVRSILLKKIREEMGAVYSVGASSGLAKYPDAYQRNTIQFYCDDQRAEELVEVCESELQKYTKNPESLSQYLENIKLNMTNSYLTKKKKNIFWSAALRNTIFNQNSDWEYVVNYQKHIEEVTAQELAAFIKNNFLKNEKLISILYPKK
ncbi:MAG: insulinase family protein [Marinifilaceae bacterium]|nr:insulinase family protein [Marinifilaceae bacterium]